MNGLEFLNNFIQRGILLQRQNISWILLIQKIYSNFYFNIKLTLFTLQLVGIEFQSN